jgi:hypothetical protein
MAAKQTTSKESSNKEITSKEKEKIISEALFKGDKYNFKSAVRQILDRVIVVETLKTILKEDKGIEGCSTLEDMLSICRKFKIDRDLWNGKEEKTVKEVIEQHFIDSVSDGRKLSDLYKNLFKGNRLVYSFTNFAVAEDSIPKDEPDTPKDIFYRKETLGTGEYDMDKDGNEIPHDEDFSDEVVYEIVHFATHLSDENLFMPTRSPDFSIGLLDNDKILIQASFVNPLDLV